MNSQSRGQPVGCAASRRITKRFVAQWIGLAAAAVIGFCQPVVAQTTTLTTTGITPGAISCGPSGNGTGHMVCLEYTTAGKLTGVSWQAPPATPDPAVFVNGVLEINRNVLEPVNTVDPFTTFAAPVGTLIGKPGCGSAFDGTGDIACLVITQASSGSFSVEGIAFYPPTNNGPATVTIPQTIAANSKIGTPSCATTFQEVQNKGGAVVCAIVIGGKLYGVGFEPVTATATALTLLSAATNFTGSPSCTSAEPQGTPTPVIPAVCAVRAGNALTGFALAFAPPGNGTAAAVSVPASITFGSMTFAGDPSCAIPGNGQVARTSFVATCGIVSGTTLFGVSFDPIDDIPNTSTHMTAFQSLGTSPDTGSWTGSVGCSSFPGGGAQNANLIGCAPISTLKNVFEVTFDPRPSGPNNVAVNRGVVGPVGANANANLTCLPLAIDNVKFYCGGTNPNGASGGYMIPVGVLSPETASVVLPFISD